MTTAIIKGHIFLEHITPQNHPEKPQRLEMAMKVLEALNWLERDGLVQIPPRAATEDELATVHEREYIRQVKAAAAEVAEEEKRGGRQTRFFATDTYISAHSYEAAIKAQDSPTNVERARGWVQRSMYLCQQKLASKHTNQFSGR